MAKRRTGRLMTAALACALAASGCVIANQAGKGTNLGDGSTVSTGLNGTNQSSSTVRGEVRLPPGHLGAAYRVSAITNEKAVSGASVTLRDYKLDKAPNAPTVKSDGNGKFTLSKVPSDHIWVVTADHGKGVAASLVSVQPKKTANVTLTLGSTLAVAAILPLFVPDESTKNAVSMDEVDVALFKKLVEAIDAVLTNDTPIPAEKAMKEYRKHFNGLKTGAVLKAYNDMVDDLKKKGTVNTKIDTNTGGSGDGTQDPGATDAEQPAASDATTATDPTDPELYKPRSGTMAKVSGVQVTASGAIQMASMSFGGLSVLVIPDGDKVHVISTLGAPKTFTGADMGLDGALTGAKSLTVNNDKGYMVASVGGQRKLLILEPDVSDMANPKLNATAKALDGEPIGAISGIVFSSEKSALIGVDEGRDVLLKIAESTATAAAEVYAGTPDKTEADPAGADSVGTILFNQPSSVAKKGGKLYVTDTEKHRVVEIDLATDKAKTIAGSPNEFKLVNGPLNYTRFQKPSGIFHAADGGFLIADRNNEALRHMDVTANKTISLVDSAVTGSDATSGYKMIPYPRGVAEFNNKVYAIDNVGNVWTWTKSGS